MRRVAVIVTCVGCGRSGFGQVVDAPVDAAPDAIDGSMLDLVDAPAGSVVLTFGDTPAGMQGVAFDTYLNSEVPQNTYNYGGSETISLEGTQKRALLRFDLTAIAPGTTIAAARLHFYVSSTEGTTAMVSVAPVTEAWTVGTLQGTAGVANYTQRTAGQNWTTPGAGSPGSSGASIGTFSAPAIGAVGVDIAAAAVQGWVDTPATNFGVVLGAIGGDDLSLASSNATTATQRPELVVTYFP